MSDDKWQPSRDAINYTAKNLFSILGLIFAFVCSPVGLILSIIGLNKAKEENGDTKFAKLGIIISAVVMVIVFVVIISINVVSCQETKQVTDMAGDLFDKFNNNNVFNQ